MDSHLLKLKICPRGETLKFVKVGCQITFRQSRRNLNKPIKTSNPQGIVALESVQGGNGGRRGGGGGGGWGWGWRKETVDLSKKP